ncbi:MAG: hypothetical protein R2911_38370 [Caldilineaceae bacterium]
MINVELPDRISHPFADQNAHIPVAVPELAEIIQFAKEKHSDQQPWRGYAYGWPAEYRVADALPAGFFIGVNGIFFVALDWEWGAEEEPYLSIEGEYGYDFDPSDQTARAKQHLAAFIPQT